MPKIITISGKGRGKTTNAIAKIFNHLSRDKDIVVAQFLKTGNLCGECAFFSKYKKIRWFCFGEDEFYLPEGNHEKFQKLLEEGIEKLLIELEQKRTNILLLDEFGIVLEYNLLNLQVLEKLTSFVEEEIIITGRKIPEKVLKKADICCVIEEIKHPFQKGILARKGIDY